MIIVMHEAVLLKRYLDEYRDRAPEWKQGCPLCGLKLVKHGRFFRFVVFGQLFEYLPVYRRRCSGCGKTFSLLPAFIRPYAHFGICVREAAARMLAKGSTVSELAARLCQSKSTGGISTRTLRHWLQGWRQRTQALTVSVIERILQLAPGFDATPYLPRSVNARGWLRSVIELGRILRDLVYETRPIPLFMFLNSCYPADMSL